MWVAASITQFINIYGNTDLDYSSGKFQFELGQVQPLLWQRIMYSVQITVKNRRLSTERHDLHNKKINHMITHISHLEQGWLCAENMLSFPNHEQELQLMELRSPVTTPAAVLAVSCGVWGQNQASINPRWPCCACLDTSCRHHSPGCITAQLTVPRLLHSVVTRDRPNSLFEELQRKVTYIIHFITHHKKAIDGGA